MREVRVGQVQGGGLVKKHLQDNGGLDQVMAILNIRYGEILNI